MISETEVLENGEGKHRCQVVRWMRTFPFSFISRREYVIARRMWRGGDGALYGITKVKGRGVMQKRRLLQGAEARCAGGLLAQKLRAPSVCMHEKCVHASKCF